MLRESRTAALPQDGAAQPVGALDAITAGLVAMLGAGVFAGLAPAAATAGRWLLIGTVIAALIALCSAFSIADQFRDRPTSAAGYAGAGYRYTRDHLGRWPGRMAAGVYLVGRMVAAAALAGCFGDYVMPARPAVAALAVLLCAIGVELALGRFRLRLSLVLARVAVCVVLLVLGVVVAACFAIAPPPPTGVPVPAGFPGADDVGGLLPAAGVAFFAFLGFERISAPGTGRPAPLRRTLLLAIPVVLVVALGTYLAVGAAVLRQLGASRLAISTAPLRDALAAADAAGLAPLVTLAAAVATSGALLIVLGGARRTIDVMVGEGDLPSSAGRGLPAAALVGVGGLSAVLLLHTADAIELAATCALGYYALTNTAARLLPAADRIWPSRSACFGLGLTVLVGLTMPAVDLIVMLAAMAAGVLLGPLGTLVGRSRGYLRQRD